MAGRRGRIAVVLGPLLALLLLLVVRQSPRTAGDVTGSPVASPDAVTSLTSVPTAADQAVAASCPGSAALSGVCGSVAGFSGFYGSWRTAGDAGAFCLEHAKKEPQAGLKYTRFTTGSGHVSMTPEDRKRLGYLLGRYAATTDSTKAAALAILVHAAEGDSLTTDQLSSYPTSLAAPVRSAVTALWAEAAQNHGPYTAGIAVSGRGAGAQATVTVRAASGQPMSGFPVSWTGSSHGEEVNTTDSSGRATLTIATVAAGFTVTAHATVGGLPAADIGVWVPEDSTVQTVAVALAPVAAAATGSWTAAPSPASVQVLKTTADPAYVSPLGAAFSVSDAAGRNQATVVADAAGHTGVVGGLIAGNGPFTIHEVTPCEGCQRALDQQVTLNPGQVAVVGVLDPVVPVVLLLRKVGLQGQPLAGAVLHLRRAGQPGGAFDTDLGVCTTTATGDCPLPGLGSLPPADYQVTEDQPAPGTTWAVPRVQTVALRKGTATVTFADPQLVSVGFHKSADPAAGAVDPTHESLAGAVFAVSGPALPTAAGADPGHAELGRCTTGADGGCLLGGDPLVEGVAYSWAELTAPPGFALDPSSHAFTACVAPCDAATVTALDQGRYAHVSLTKHVAGDTGAAVAGATVDLCATGLPDPLAATFPAPAASACDAAAISVGTGITDAHGGIDFGLLPPGPHYCAIERLAPAGFQLNPVPVCGDLGAAGLVTDAAPQELVLDLAETPTPAPATAAPAPPAAAPPAATAPPVQAAPRPSPSVLRLAVTRPGSHPSPPAPPVVAPQAPLAFTGTEHIANTLELGAGLILLGLALLVGGSSRSTRGRAWS